MADRLTYGQEQAEKNLSRWQGLSGNMRKPSYMASPEERAAYTAQEVRAGDAPEYELPEDYGGRPQGTTRRAIRAQVAWDAEQAARIQQEQAMRQQQADMEQAAREEQKFQLDYASKAYDLRTKQNEDLFELRTAADLKQAEAEFTEFRNKLNPNNPESAGMIYSYISSDPRLADSKVAYTSAEYFDKAAKNSVASINAKTQEEAQNKYAEDMQKLMETGVTEEELPQYYDPDSPIGMPQFDRRKLAARLGGSKAQEKAEAKTTKEETPKEKIGLDLQQAYGELNALLLSGQDEVAAASKVAGLRARYKAATGEDAPEVPFQPKSKAEYDRVPAGRPYIGQDGKTRIKQ
jgi:hypothetical protein